jgi:hypothetical protein
MTVFLGCQLLTETRLNDLIVTDYAQRLGKSEKKPQILAKM